MQKIWLGPREIERTSIIQRFYFALELKAILPTLRGFYQTLTEFVFLFYIFIFCFYMAAVKTFCYSLLHISFSFDCAMSVAFLTLRLWQNS
jgi:hypothetical protein